MSTGNECPYLESLGGKKEKPPLGKNLSTPLDDYHLEDGKEDDLEEEGASENDAAGEKEVSSVGEREATITCPFSSLRKKATFGSALNSGGRPLSSDTSLNFGR